MYGFANLRHSLPGPLLVLLAALSGCSEPLPIQSAAGPTATPPAQSPQSDPAASAAVQPTPVEAAPNASPAASTSSSGHDAPAITHERVAAKPSPDGTAAKTPVAKRPKADRDAAADGVQKITFDDLILGMQADMVFRPWMLEANERTKELEGKAVRLPGVMHGGLHSGKKNKEFVLLRNAECKFGQGGQADHVAKVLMKEGKTVSYTADTVLVEGTLRITPTTGKDGNTWWIYTIENAELK